MELRQLGYFKAAAEAGSFSEAARRCFVTQPTLSQQVRAMEQELGCNLFDRNDKSLKLTAEGERLLASARRILAEVDRAVTEVRDGTESKRLVVGYYGNALAPYLGDIFAYFHDQHRGIHLEAIEAERHKLTELLVQGSLDCAFTVASPDPDFTEALDFAVVHICGYVVLVREGMLRQRSGEALSLAKDLPVPLVTLSRLQSARLSDRMSGAGAGSSQSRAVLAPTNTHRALMLLVASGQCAALAPEDTWAPLPHIAAYPLADPELTYQTCLAWQRGHKSPAVDAFINACRKVITERGDGVQPIRG